MFCWPVCVSGDSGRSPGAWGDVGIEPLATTICTRPPALWSILMASWWEMSNGCPSIANNWSRSRRPPCLKIEIRSKIRAMSLTHYPHFVTRNKANHNKSSTLLGLMYSKFHLDDLETAWLWNKNLHQQKAKWSDHTADWWEHKYRLYVCNY